MATAKKNTVPAKKNATKKPADKAPRETNLQQPEFEDEGNDKPGIKWKFVEIDKSLIKPNPNNPKVRKEKGMAQLDKLTKKFGRIFDGILNADMSLIDGHSRLEMYPEGTGNYFVPDAQLGPDDEKELNALFDVARAGDPDMFMIEQILGEEMLDEWSTDNKKKLKKGAKNAATGDDCKYPIVPQYDERYEAIIIMCTNTIDTLFIKEVLKIEKTMSYKNRNVKESSIITAKKFIEEWNKKQA